MCFLHMTITKPRIYYGSLLRLAFSHKFTTAYNVQKGRISNLG